MEATWPTVLPLLSYLSDLAPFNRPPCPSVRRQDRQHRHPDENKRRLSSPSICLPAAARSVSCILLSHASHQPEFSGERPLSPLQIAHPRSPTGRCSTCCRTYRRSSSTHTRRSPDARDLFRVPRTLAHFIDSSFRQADGRDNPVAAIAPHALPSVLAHVGPTLGAFETPIQLALLELRPHPRQGIDEIMRTVRDVQFFCSLLTRLVHRRGSVVIDESRGRQRTSS